MLNTVDLLNKYKDEKALVIGSEAERTGLEDFPSWKEWKAEYEKEWAECHVTVDIEDADAYFDAIAEAAEEELGDTEFEATAEESDEDEEEVVETAPEPEVKKAVKAKVIGRTKMQKAVNKAKKTDVRKVKKPDVRKVKKPDVRKLKAPFSKTEKAQKIFTRFHGKPNWDRKRMIAKFVAEVGLTPAGASTYYAKFKKNA